MKCLVCVGCIVSANALFFLNCLGCLIRKKKAKEKKGARGNGIKGKGEKTSLGWTFKTWLNHTNKDWSLVCICCHSDMTNQNCKVVFGFVCFCFSTMCGFWSPLVGRT